MTNKIICEDCGKEKTVSSYMTFVKEDKIVYGERIGKKLVRFTCECGGYMDLKKEKLEGPIIGFMYGKFSSLSPHDKQMVLRKRSREDAKKQKYVDNDRERTRYNG